MVSVIKNHVRFQIYIKGDTADDKVATEMRDKSIKGKNCQHEGSKEKR